jgi:hypothetical protein
VGGCARRCPSPSLSPKGERKLRCDSTDPARRLRRWFGSLLSGASEFCEGQADDYAFDQVGRRCFAVCGGTGGGDDPVTQRVTIETVDPEGRTVAFTKPDGQLVILPVTDSVGNLASIQDGAPANVTYNEVVTLLNLRQKGPGSKEERRESMNPKRNPTDIEAGRFTVTVVGVDLANNTVSVIDGRGGVVHTYKANTAAKQDMLKKTKVGDVVIGLTTPLMVTAISPAP